MKAGSSELLAVGQLVIAGLKNSTGHGDPECGEAFARGESTFSGVNALLKSAVPGDGWEGAGAYAYADQNTRQQLRSAAMADADRGVHKVLSREARQIALRRGHLDDQYNLLASAGHLAAPYSQATKLAIEVAALQAALGESCRQMNQLQSEVMQNAAELHQAVGRYAAVADGAELPGLLQAPVATRFDSDNPAGTPLRDGR